MTPEQVAAALRVTPPVALAVGGVIALAGTRSVWSASLDIARLLVPPHGRHQGPRKQRGGALKTRETVGLARDGAAGTAGVVVLVATLGVLAVLLGAWAVAGCLGRLRAARVDEQSVLEDW